MMKNMTWTQKMDKEHARDFWTSWRDSAKFSKQTVRPEIIENNFQKPTKYYIKKGVCATWLKFLTLH